MLSLIAALLSVLPLGSPPQAAGEDPFPASSAIAEGVSPEALGRLDGLVQSLVDDEEIVGAELLVVVNGRSILHEAYGWSDLDAKAPMETGSVFCVRSMTKPLIGTAILMLVDEDRLELDDRIAEYLPSFDVEGSAEITVEHLLAHTSGLALSLLLGRDLRELDGIGAVADLGGGYTLDFVPGSAFAYSDQGTDTLTALIEVVSGMSAADFVRTRVLAPLGMRDSACVLTEDHPLRARAIPKYVGSRGEWSRFWSPDGPPLFPFFLGSQGLYSTLEDYARFADFWRRKGRTAEKRLLAARHARKALTPGPYPPGGPTGLPGLRTDYGSTWLRRRSSRTKASTGRARARSASCSSGPVAFAPTRPRAASPGSSRTTESACGTPRRRSLAPRSRLRGPSCSCSTAPSRASASGAARTRSPGSSRRSRAAAGRCSWSAAATRRRRPRRCGSTASPAASCARRA
jgi:CubicO group peptidase (beta-lactamase class C family)